MRAKMLHGSGAQDKMEMNSPFSIPLEDTNALCASEAFQILRKYMAGNARNTFCAQHAECTDTAKDTYLLHRDILHALIMPVVQLYKRASSLASAALCVSGSEDLELAFAGDARGAFLFLQCFATEEEEWCWGNGCPACITTATLSTESHTRLTIASSLLSTSPPFSPTSSTATSPTISPSSSPAVSPTTTADQDTAPSTPSRTLPPLPHILPALRAALSADPFWGPDFYPYIHSKAEILYTGIQSLIPQCRDLEMLVLSPPNSPAPSTRQPLRKPSGNPGARQITRPVGSRISSAPVGRTPRTRTDSKADETRIALQKSQLARWQGRMSGEEVELLARRAAQCWGRVELKGMGLELGVGGVDRMGRGRRGTCP